MRYKSTYRSPIGDLFLLADDEGLMGLWLGKQDSRFSDDILKDAQEKDNKAIKETRKWLDIYFTGEEPEFTPELHLEGSEFQLRVWNKLLEIPYGVTTTYGELAKEIALEESKEIVSAQAIGGAVGHNPISIIVPCHRVIGSDGSLTGYGGGLGKKKKLLQLEGAFDEI